MKTKILLIGGLALGVLFAGCKKGSSSTTTNNVAVSTADIASAVGSGLATNGYGMVSQIQDASNLTTSGLSVGGNLMVSGGSGSGIGQTGVMTAVASTGTRDTLPCGFTKNVSFSVKDSNSVFVYSHYVHYYFMMSCVNKVRNTLNMSDSSSGYYNGPRMVASTISYGNMALTGLTKADTALTYNGSFLHSGTHVSKINDSVSFYAVFKFYFNNTVVSKTTHEIVGGTATITVTGANKKKVPFNYTGTVTFLGRRKAKIEINNDTYVFNLVTGDFDKI